MAVLEAHGVSKTYGSGRLQVRAVREVSLAIDEGEAVALMGPSGSGKSTLLGVLGLIVTATAGRIVVEGTLVTNDERRRARLRNEFFGYVHQEFAIVDDDTVEQNVMVPLEYARPRVHRRDRRARVRAAVRDVGLEWALAERACRLSGGERQRVAIARALVNEPTLVLADEPTAALDAATAREIVTLLLSLRQRGAAVLLATHDPRVAERCDRVLQMVDGRIVSDNGDPDARNTVPQRIGTPNKRV